MPGTHGASCGCKHESEIVGSEFLLPYIDTDGIRGMNEQIPGSAKLIFKTYADRLSEEKCESEVDDSDLIIHIPFKSPCKVSSFHLIGGDRGLSPKSVKFYVDRPDLDFDALESTKPVQTVELHEDYCGAIEYPLKVNQFQNVTLLSLAFKETFGGNYNQLFYIGLRGEGSNFKRQAVVTVYESSAQRADHEVKEDELRQSMAPGF